MALPLLHGRGLRRETAARLTSRGLVVTDVEVVRMSPALVVAELTTVFDAAEVWAHHVLVVNNDPIAPGGPAVW